MRTTAVLVIEGCDNAILGYVEEGSQVRAAYSYNRLIEHFAEEFADHDEPVLEAQDWVWNNIMQSAMGPGTPIVVMDGNRETVDLAAVSLIDPS